MFWSVAANNGIACREMRASWGWSPPQASARCLGPATASASKCSRLAPLGAPPLCRLLLAWQRTIARIAALALAEGRLFFQLLVQRTYLPPCVCARSLDVCQHAERRSPSAWVCATNDPFLLWRRPVATTRTALREQWDSVPSTTGYIGPLDVPVDCFCLVRSTEA